MSIFDQSGNRLLTISEVSTALDVGRSRVSQLIQAGRLEHVTSEHRIYVKQTSVDERIAERSNKRTYAWPPSMSDRATIVRALIDIGLVKDSEIDRHAYYELRRRRSARRLP